MPELPEVESIARRIRPRLVGQRGTHICANCQPHPISTDGPLRGA